MKKSVRRILSLALVLVLVCALAATAFATPSSFFVEEDYDNERYIAHAQASITTSTAEGQVGVEDTQLGKMVTGQSRYVSMQYSYTELYGSQTLLRSNSMTNTNTATLVARVEFRAAQNQTLVSATFTFWADVPTSQGTQRFAPDTVALSC